MIVTKAQHGWPVEDVTMGGVSLQARAPSGSYIDKLVSNAIIKISDKDVACVKLCKGV